MSLPVSFLTVRPRLLLGAALFGSALVAVACDLNTQGTSSPGDTSTPAAGDAGGDPVATDAAPATDTGTPTPTPEAGSDAQADAGNAPDAVADASNPSDASDASDASSAVPSICTYANGTPIPYDHTRGIVEEFSLELYMNCDLGGYLTPLVNADPQNLTAVTAFNADLADWYRARILGCSDATTTAPSGSLLLLPVSEASEISRADFNGVVKLYMSILKRHDGQPDGYDDAKKNAVKKRLLDLAPTAVKKQNDTMSLPSADPGCMPSPPDPDAG